MKLDKNVHSYGEAVEVVESLMKDFFVKHFKLENSGDGFRVIVKYTEKKEEG